MVLRLPHNVNELLCTSLAKEELVSKFALCVENDMYLKDIISKMSFKKAEDKAEFSTFMDNNVSKALLFAYEPTLVAVNELAMNHVVNRLLRIKFKNLKNILEAIKRYGHIS